MSTFTGLVLTVEDLISKAKVQLKKIVPFFMYIVEHLQMQEDNTIPTIGVSPKAVCKYNAEFIKKLTTDELIGVLVHEVMHPALRHFTRQGMRTLSCNGISLWNWMADVQINQMIIENGLTLPACGVIPVNDQIMFGSIQIENIHKKSTEELYNLF
jgi:predicted metal-dependent peptidase